MIYLEKGIENTIVLTLTESTTLSNAQYLFEFSNEFNKQLTSQYWVGVDVSTSTNRYNKFILNEGVDITFIKGQYVYRVFEFTGVLDEENPSEGLTEIEEGRMIVDGIVTNNIYE